MTLPFSLLHWCANNAPLGALRDSAFRKIARGFNGQERDVTTEHGVHMRVRIGDPVDTALAIRRVFEPGLTTLFTRLIPNINTYVDVGCNIGYFTCLVQRLAPQARILAIDANPTMIARARANAERNHFTAIIWENIGVGQTDGELTFYINDERPSLASFGAGEDRDAAIAAGHLRPQTVRIEPLPVILARSGISGIDLLKIDIEGFEPALFAGLTPEVVASIQRMVFECSPTHSARCGFTPEQIFDLTWWDQYRLYGYRGDAPTLTPIAPRAMLDDWEGIYAERTSLPPIC